MQNQYKVDKNEDDYIGIEKMDVDNIETCMLNAIKIYKSIKHLPNTISVEDILWYLGRQCQLQQENGELLNNTGVIIKDIMTIFEMEVLSL